ncbi:MAG TPA: ATP-binding protein [Clostridiales bacterium]|nr:ATP-binding protein [Clostridiales bacterium]
MNRISIKLKVTLWYTALMVILVALMFAFIFSISKSLAESSARNDLIKTVEDSLDEVEYDDGKLDVDNDLDFFSHGIYLSVYDKDMRQVYGRIPKELVNPPALALGKMQTVASGDSRWYVYDSRVSIKKYGDAWVRGVVALSDSENTINTMLSIAGIALPFLVIIAALGGYLITRQAFKPVREINETAERIGEGRDLSQRIHISKGKDEIHTLASTFNDMFDRLEHSFESERQFTSDASHELRTPVSVIISQGEYALESAKTLEEAKGALSVILAQARKMSGLISQLLTLSRIDRGHNKLTPELLNLSDLTEMVAEDQREAAMNKSIEIRTSITPDLYVNADETMMLRMLINLVSNAITYGKSGGHVTIELTASGKEIIGSVADDGIGMATEHLPRIWERFYQVDPSRTAGKEGGVGLGLSMVKWIVEAHGGKITVNSKLGEGTTFTFVLPMVK